MAQPQAKWFADLAADMPPRTAALTVIEARAAIVRDWMAACASGPRAEPDSIHQLRVSSRRLVAALDSFKSVLPAEPVRRLRKSAARLRRAAGAVRDLDVQIGTLNGILEALAWMPAHFAGTIEDLLIERRERAADSLSRSLPARAGRFERRLANLLEQIRLPASVDNISVGTLASNAGTLGELHAAVIPERMTALLGAGSADLSDADNVHQLRIAGKRLRYALEVFAGCEQPSERKSRYDEVQSLQEQLGRINDLRHLFATLADLRRPIVKQARSGEADVLRSLMDRLLAVIGFEWMSLQRSFVQWWNDVWRATFEAMRPAPSTLPHDAPVREVI